MRPRRSPEERRRQRGLWARARRELQRQIDTDEALRAEVRERSSRTLLALATIYSGRLPRPRIRALARRVSLLMPLRTCRFLQGEWDGFDTVGRERLDVALASGRGAIIAPMHLGDYRTLAAFLVLQGYPVTGLYDARNADLMKRLLANGYLADFLLDAAPSMAEMQARGATLAWRNEAGTLERLPVYDEADRWEGYDEQARWGWANERLLRGVRVVSSAAHDSLWQLRRSLAQRRLLVVFVDANHMMTTLAPEGAAAASRGPAATSVPVRLFDLDLRVRPGMAALSAATGAPIVPVVLRDRSGLPPELEFLEPIAPAPDEDAGCFVPRAMQALYAHLEHEVRLRPGRWEEWSLLPRWWVRGESPPEAAPPPADGLELAPLLMHRLSLENPRLWVVELEGSRHAVDLGRWQSLGQHHELVSLVDAAERRELVIDWLRGCPEPAVAAPTLNHMVEAGHIALT